MDEMKGKKNKKKTPVKSSLNLKVGSISFGPKNVNSIEKVEKVNSKQPEERTPREKFCSISKVEVPERRNMAGFKHPSIIVHQGKKSPIGDKQSHFFKTEPDENLKQSTSEKDNFSSLDSDEGNNFRTGLQDIKEESESFGSLGNEAPAPSGQIDSSQRKSLSLSKTKSNKFTQSQKTFSKKKIFGKRSSKFSNEKKNN